MVYAPRYPIETDRLRLRPFTRGDVDAVFAYRQRADVARYLSDGPMTRESVAEALQMRVGQEALRVEGDKIFLAVETKERSGVIGELSLILRDEAGRQGEIGYILDPGYHGQGYATEAGAKLLEMGFDGAGLHRIYARCAAANHASWRVMERLGMRREAHFREHAFVKGAWDEEFVYAVLEDEWRTAERR
ncbi:GNAT family protein [Devosia sp. ZB163]|uniref:GNAT family N-acetyltransferase n=1 Tax=Devosia sp. ZB163 TaxID=3025938 RepID=UPI00235E50C5|nr:GNAT family protein [Devosia sp. ZB163]MDC9824457.1 GNAT family protein [Devosia sp. ZB163]